MASKDREGERAARKGGRERRVAVAMASLKEILNLDKVRQGNTTD